MPRRWFVSIALAPLIPLPRMLRAAALALGVLAALLNGTMPVIAAGAPQVQSSSSAAVSAEHAMMMEGHQQTGGMPCCDQSPTEKMAGPKTGMAGCQTACACCPVQAMPLPEPTLRWAGVMPLPPTVPNEVVTQPAHRPPIGA